MNAKGDTITEIMRINRGASAEFLAEFSSEQLTEYLQRLHGLPGTDRSAPARGSMAMTRATAFVQPVRLA